MSSEHPRKPPLRENVRWTLLGSIANSACNWLLIVSLARAAGSTAVGLYALALALTDPVFSFAGFQMRALLASDPRGKFAFGEYLRVTTLGAAGAVAVTLMLTATVEGVRAAWAVLLAVCSMRSTDAFVELYSGLWQRRERMHVIAAARALQAVVTLGTATIVLRLHRGAMGAAVAGALGSFAALALLYVATRRDPEIERPAPGTPPSWARLRRLAAQGFPLGVIVLLGVLQANVPRYFIQRHAGQAALGLFAAASQLTTAGNVLIAALGAAAVPRLAAWHAASDPAYYRLTRKLVLVGLALGACGVAASALIGTQVLALIYRPEFAAAQHTLVVLSLAALVWFVAAIQGSALTAARIIAVQPIILAVTLVTLATSCAVLVPRMGAIGAAWALVAGTTVQALAGYLVLLRSRAAAAAIAETSRGPSA